MNLESKVNDAIKQAMIAKNQGALRGLRALKSAIIMAKTEKGASDVLSKEQELQLVNKLLKQRKDSLEIFTTQNRNDLAEKEQEEIMILQTFLPAQMSDAELEKAIKQIIAEQGASSIKDMGKVMAATKVLAGKADNKSIADWVKKLLA